MNPERASLAAFYAAAGGPDWRNNDGWLTEAPLGEWHGVTVDSSGRVTRLILADNNLAGAIAPETGNLGSLTQLVLSLNDLAGGLPAELGNLGELTQLILSENGLGGVIPSELGKLAKLEGLHLGNNALAGAIPPETGDLSSLKVLLVDGNELEAPLPGSLAQLRLELFSFQDNSGLCAPGTTEFVSWIQSIASANGQFCNQTDRDLLASLHAATNGEEWKESGRWLRTFALGEWHGIRADSLGRALAIDLSGNGLDGRLPSQLGRLSRLTELNLGDNDGLEGRLPQSLTALPLTDLSYAGTELCAPGNDAFRTWLAQVASHDGTGQECPALNDRDILVELYRATNGGGWRRSENWLTDAPLEEWYGVRTDVEGRVTHLELSKIGLRGVVPTEIGDLSRLRKLNLSSNWLESDIPPELGGMPALEELDLSGNSLGGIVPAEIADLGRLAKLSLGWNMLHGAIPPELAQLTRLEALSLTGNRLEGIIPPEVAGMASLVSLELGENRLKGAIPPEIARASGLTVLDLAGNRLAGAIPPEVDGLARLATLDLQQNQLAGEIPSAMGNLAQLQHLLLSQNRFSGAVPPEVGELARLESLHLSHNSELAGALPAGLASNANMNELLAAGTGLCAPRDSVFQRWLAGVRKRRVAPCPGSADSGSRAYLTQAVQSFGFPVPLAAGEPALLRVFVAAAGAGGERMPPVRVRFYRGGSEVHVENIPAPDAAIPSEISEDDLDASANAEIPGSLVQPGLEMVVEIDPAGTLDPALEIAKRIPAEGRAQLDIRPLPGLDLTLVPFLASSSPDSSILDITSGLTPGDTLLWPLRALLPVGDIDLEIHAPVITSSNNAFFLLEEIVALRVLEGAAGHYMGTIAGRPTGAGGLANAPGRASFSIPRADVMAHELGHNLSLTHAPCGGPRGVDRSFPSRNGSIGSWGYDFRDSVLVNPRAHDLMSYCREPVYWISDYHFANALRFRIADEVGGAAAVADGLADGSQMAMSGGYEYGDDPVAGGGRAAATTLLIWGGAERDGTPFLEPAFLVTDGVPALPPPGRGDYLLAGRSAQGDILFSYSFDMPRVMDGDGRSAFAFALPYREEWAGSLASIAVAGRGGSFTLDGDSGRAAAIVRDPRTGRVRGIFRDAYGAGRLPAASGVAPAGQAAAAARAIETELEVLVSHGIPRPATLRRQ